MIEQIKDFFSFTRGERNGIFILVIIIFVLLFLPKILNSFKESEDFDFVEFENQIKEFKNSLVLKKKESNRRKYAYKKKSDKGISNIKRKSNLKNNINYIPDKKYLVSKSDTVIKWTLRIFKINSVDSTELLSIYGIGSILSKRIIKYRDLLGGFYDKSQLLEVYGIDSAKLESIRSNIQIDTIGIKKINLNNATLSQLRYHPYLSSYESRAIIDYQKYKGKIISIEEIVRNNLLSEEKFQKIKIYLKTN